MQLNLYTCNLVKNINFHTCKYIFSFFVYETRCVSPKTLTATLYGASVILVTLSFILNNA